MAEQPIGNSKTVLYPSRKSPRLSTYDYSSAGYYFVTICTRHRECFFGEIIKEAMSLNCAGQMAASTWADIPRRFDQVLLDSFVVMPNHIHGIIVLKEGFGVGTALVSGRPCVSRVIQAFKSTSTNEYIRGVNQEGWNKFDQTLWQKSFSDHVIRNEKDLLRVQEYILSNPLQWAIDDENPDRRSDTGPTQGSNGRTQGPPLRTI
jgi:REP element-mobilizing transposase RayT